MTLIYVNSQSLKIADMGRVQWWKFIIITRSLTDLAQNSTLWVADYENAVVWGFTIANWLADLTGNIKKLKNYTQYMNNNLH